MIWTIFRKSQFRWALVGLLVVLVLVQLFWTQPSTDYWSNVSRLLPVDGLIVKPFSKEKVPIGKLHFLIAATQANKFFCRTLLSATVTRYGPPVIAGWRATGINDAGASHLAKIRVVLQYLDQLPKSADDDLFLAVDGYDVYMQFGADVLIERYYQLVQQEDGRVLQQLGPADADRIAGPLGRHVFFGYDKGCAPDRPTLVGCWAGSGPNHHTLMTFGPETDTGHPFFNHPRWLNSGTVMGPIREVRDIYRATLALIESTYDLTDPDRDHDQFYIGTLWGEQEYERILAQLKEDPSAPVHKGPDNAVIPALEPGRSYNKHIALDYDGQLFQPWAANEWWVEFRNFSGPQFSYRVEQNIDESPKFRPWQFHLPGESLASLHRIWSSTPKPDQALLGQTSNELVRSSRFGSSHVTRSVFGMWHCTLDKSALDKFWPQLWFNSLSQPLVRSAIAWFRDGPNPFTPKPINGRVWYPARTYPATISLDDGGAWSDTSSDDGTVSWLSWQDICHEFEADPSAFSPWVGPPTSERVSFHGYDGGGLMGPPWRYGIVFDAGSSGTRMHVYRWNDSIDAQPSAPEADLRTLPRITLQATEKTRPGVSSFATHPSDIGPDHLHILIDAALDIIPGDHVSSTPVFLMATAGMRLLDQDQQTSLLNEMCAFFKSSTPFQVADCQSQIRVIPGETEGLYGWIASNYLFGGFDHPDAHQHGKGHHTIGFLDMGGASTQIAFVPNATETSKHANDLKLVRLRLLNGDKVEYKVFVATWLGYGANLARDRYVDRLVAGGPGQNISMLDDPCMPHGLWTTLNGNLILDDERPESGIMTLRGTGDFQRCLQLTVSLLSKDVACKHEPCLLDGKHAPAIDFDINHFLGISEFWYTTHGVFGGAGTSYDLETYQKRVHDFCAREWKDIQGSLLSTEKQNVRKMKDSQESCFKAAWLISFLYEGIGIPRRLRVDNVPAYSFNATTGPLDKAVGTVLLDPFRPVDQIGGIDVSWALGKMVLHVSGAVPASGLFDDPVGFGSNDPTLDDFEESGPIRSGFLDQAGDSYRNFRSASMVTPAVLAFFVLLLLAAFLLRKRESRHCLYGVTNSCSGRCHGMARRPPRGFSLTSKLFGRRSGVAYERLQEEGATDRFELGPIDSDEQDKSDGSEGSAGAGRLSVSKSTLTLSAMDRSGLVSRTQSRERLSPNALLPGPGWHSRAPSPTKPKNLLLDDSKAQ